jgi:hypothetical protein
LPALLVKKQAVTQPKPAQEKAPVKPIEELLHG